MTERPRQRLRSLGLKIGRYDTGAHNAITDVAGVKVGHSTIIEGDAGARVPGTGPIRTGVTAILPAAGDIFDERVIGGGFVLNGAGEVSGLTQLLEWGLLETPIFLTNTLSVGAVSSAAVARLVKDHPGIGSVHDVLIPVVGECDDSWLNDVAGQHVKAKHVNEAFDSASGGAVLEGSVGGGTGMITCDLKGGIGTSSRVLPEANGGYTVGVLVMSNFGELNELRVGGFPLGMRLEDRFRDHSRRRHNYGSIIAVVATDAPLMSMQVSRLCKRAALGIGRVGSTAAHGSGEIIVGFSTRNRVPRATQTGLVKGLEVLLDTHINPLYQAVIEATEEAILNALCMAEPMSGADGAFCPALPLDAVEEVARLMT